MASFNQWEFEKKVRGYIEGDQHGRSQAAIARALGRNPDTFNKWVRGVNKMPVDVIEALCRLLGKGAIEFSELLKLAGHPVPSIFDNRSTPYTPPSSELDEDLLVGKQNRERQPQKVSSPSSHTFNFPHDLLASLDHFRFRDAEIEQLYEELQPGITKVLCGITGMGKTVLAAKVVLKIAQEDPERFSDVFFYSFEDQHTANMALEDIVRRYSEEEKPTSLRDAAANALRDKRLLVFLDATEKCDDLRKVIKVIGPVCGILITSQREDDALIFKFEPYNVEKLPNIQARELLQELAGEGVVDDHIALQLCREVDFITLAIVLIAHILKIRQEPADKFLILLKQAPVNVLDISDDAHRSIRRLLDICISNLRPQSQQLLAIMGRLALTPVARAALAAGLGTNEASVMPGLYELEDYKLVIRDKNLYTLRHQLFREYCRYYLGLPLNSITRLAKFYTDLARYQQSLGVAGHAALDLVRPHIMEVLPVCDVQAEWEIVKELVWSIDDYLSIKGHRTERVTALRIGLSAVRKLEDRNEEGKLLGNLGTAYVNFEQVKQAIEHYEQALTIHREIGNRSGEGTWLGNLGTAYRYLGQVVQAIKHYEQALAIHREIGDRQSEGTWLGNLGNAYADLGQVEQAIECYEQALAIHREIGDRSSEGGWLGNLGIIYVNLGQVEQAIEYYEQALAIHREVGNRSGEGTWLGNLGIIYVNLGQVEQAIEYYEQALTIHREIGNRSSEGTWLGNLGNAYVNLGQVEQAIECYEQALTIHREIGNRSSEGIWLGNLGTAYRQVGQVEQAIKYYEQALAIYREIGDRSTEGNLLGNLGIIYVNLGQVEQAIEYYEQALTIHREIGNRSGEGTWLGNLGNAYVNLGQVEQAIEYYEQALAIHREIGDRQSEGGWLGNLGNAYADLGQVEQAIKYYEQALAIYREIGDRQSEGGWLGNLGIIYVNLGQVEQAIEYYEQALAIHREIGNRSGEGTWLGNLGNAYVNLGQVEQAIECYEQALTIHREIGDRSGEGAGLGNLGNAYRQLGQVEQAIKYYEQALAIYREIGDRSTEGNLLGNLGIIYVNLGQVEQAIEYYEQALAIHREIGDRQSEGGWLGNFGNAYRQLGQMEQTIDHYRQAIAIYRQIGDRQSEGIMLCRLGKTLAQLDRYEEAVEAYQTALKLNPNNALDAYIGIGVVTFHQGQQTKAKEYFQEALNIWGIAWENKLPSAAALLENKALALLGVGEQQQALNELKDALKQRTPSDIIDFTLYDLLNDSPEPPDGLDEMRQLLEQTLQQNNT